MTSTPKPATHSSFTIDRVFPHPPSRVFAAWSSADAKAKWFAGPNEWKKEIREMDFRVGGRERVRGKFPTGATSDFQAYYHDIVQDRRIVLSYDMYVSDTKISVSLATLELEPAGDGTRLVYTEQSVFLDGFEDNGSRAQGTAWLFGKLADSLTT
jgi:uncharacterized protein YndB with AHSA1/START domain